ncbi:unnamed protein product [Amoebophrya sp. A120]|nr:unnamed protein product [Amoebophrya sp. A120]|eukprot:GSA120T00017910001.1
MQRRTSSTSRLQPAEPASGRGSRLENRALASRRDGSASSGRQRPSSNLRRQSQVPSISPSKKFLSSSRSSRSGAALAGEESFPDLNVKGSARRNIQVWTDDLRKRLQRVSDLFEPHERRALAAVRAQARAQNVSVASRRKQDETPSEKLAMLHHRMEQGERELAQAKKSMLDFLEAAEQALPVDLEACAQ